MSRFHLFILGVLTSLLPLCSKAQSTSKSYVKVSGEVKKTLSLSGDDLAKMKRTTGVLKGRDGKDYNYSGVSIQEILGTAGVTIGKELRGENLTKYVLVKCMDGYEILFSLAELDSSFTDRIVLLADELEGKPLPDGKGPFRLVVPGEKLPARSGLQVVEFVIKYAKE